MTGDDLAMVGVLSAAVAFALWLVRYRVRTRYSAEARREDESAVSAPQQVVVEHNPVGAPLRVLLVEDTEVNQVLVRRIISRMGHEIEIADDGLAGVERARESSYDLILMDIQMPRMDGIEACGHILAEARARGVKAPAIVALTANADEENRERCMAAGMSDFVSKPFSLESLQHVIARVAEREDGHGGPVEAIGQGYGR